MFNKEKNSFMILELILLLEEDMKKIIQCMLKCNEKLINKYFSNKEIMTKIRNVIFL